MYMLGEELVDSAYPNSKDRQISNEMEGSKENNKETESGGMIKEKRQGFCRIWIDRKV